MWEVATQRASPGPVTHFLKKFSGIIPSATLIISASHCIDFLPEHVVHFQSQLRMIVVWSIYDSGIAQRQGKTTSSKSQF
jgi:hypothetical protein